MSKLTDIIQAFVDNQQTISVYKPGVGYILGKAERLDGDVVSITPDSGSQFVIHVSQFSVERD